ncbi:hypothetical protein NL676_026186 [Syzygium grande]|nr:hypothetical protein NL676_026186 [Syzygium grande]
MVFKFSTFISFVPPFSVLVDWGSPRNQEKSTVYHIQTPPLPCLLLLLLLCFSHAFTTGSFFTTLFHLNRRSSLRSENEILKTWFELVTIQ